MAAVARLIVSVLLPTPPFQARSAMTFIGVPSHESSSVAAGRQTATQPRLPVRQQIYVHTRLLVWTCGRVGGLTLRCSKLTPPQERAKVAASSPVLRPKAVRRKVRSHSFTAWLWPDLPPAPIPAGLSRAVVPPFRFCPQSARDLCSAAQSQLVESPMMPLPESADAN